MIADQPPPARPVASDDSRAAPRGLTAVEATARLARDGPNAVPSGNRFWAVRTLHRLHANSKRSGLHYNAILRFAGCLMGPWDVRHPVQASVEIGPPIHVAVEIGLPIDASR